MSIGRSNIEPHDIYAYIYDEMEAARRLANDLDVAALAARRKVTELGGMLVLVRDLTCMNCHGKGKVWHSYDQDSTRLEDCTVCKGSGARNA